MVPAVTTPIVCVYALQGDTKIVVYRYNGQEETVITIPEGHLFMMSGDLVHCGYNFLTANSRIHFYLETVDLTTSDRNMSGWVEWDDFLKCYKLKKSK